MKTIAALIFLVSLQAVYAADKIKAGTFSLATEAGWAAAFELKEDGSAIIVPAHDSEKADGSINPKPSAKKVQATWKRMNEGIEIAYSQQRDPCALRKSASSILVSGLKRFSRAPRVKVFLSSNSRTSIGLGKTLPQQNRSKRMITVPARAIAKKCFAKVLLEPI